MTDSDVQWLARRIDALEAKMEEYVRVHAESHKEIDKAVDDISDKMATLLGAITTLKYILGAPLFVGALLLIIERVIG